LREARIFPEMKPPRRPLDPRANLLPALVAALLVTLQSPAARAEEIPPIPRLLPPAGEVELPPVLRAALEERSSALADAIWGVGYHPHEADAAVLVKAVAFALEFGEFYDEKEIPRAERFLDLAEERLRELESGDDAPSWLAQRGLVVRGYRSRLDGSYQPFGLEIPESLDLSRPVPLLVWLHGRGDKTTDLHFLHQCLSRSQAFQGKAAEQTDAIVLHPFGRHCVGWKHAGEIDVFEAIERVLADYPVDPDRIALAGFSMGGAGAWHIGAHYRDRFCAVHAGAGFAETKEYVNLSPEDYPLSHVQTLWQLYDAPAYRLNFLNGPVLAYSGAEDKQKQAADLMERELAEVGLELPHLVGEGMGHRYDEESVAAIWAWLRDAWAAGRDPAPREVVWQTPTLRYPGHSWLRLEGLEQHWTSATARGRLEPGEGGVVSRIVLDLEKVEALSIGTGGAFDLAGAAIELDGARLEVARPGFPVHAVHLVRGEDGWSWGEPARGRKRPGMQGPIDDAFLDRFVVVGPDRAPDEPAFARWVDFELGRFRDRWAALMRGRLPEKASGDLTSEDIREANLVLWGDPESNPMIAEIAASLPVTWTGTHFTIQGESYERGSHVPVFVYPNPLNPDRYVVLNSGLTFREAHDRTNSQQNPKLPDWAVLGLDRLPDAEAAGRFVAGGFFDESWQ